jgi:hypothetical protein
MDTGEAVAPASDTIVLSATTFRELLSRLARLENGFEVRGTTHAPSTRPARAQVKLPPVSTWDSKVKDRDARVFVADVRRQFDWYGLHSPQDFLEFLKAHLDEPTRQLLDQVWVRLKGQGVDVSWERIEQEFLLLTGAAYARNQEDARRAFIEGKVKQVQGNTVAQYRAHFDAMRGKAGGPEAVPESMAILHFIHGLLPSLSRHCSGTHIGEPYPDLEAAFKSARQEEQKQAADITRAPAPVAAAQSYPPQFRNGKQRKRTRGKGGKGDRDHDEPADGGSSHGDGRAPAQGGGGDTSLKKKKQFNGGSGGGNGGGGGKGYKGKKNGGGGGQQGNRNKGYGASAPVASYAHPQWVPPPPGHYYAPYPMPHHPYPPTHVPQQPVAAWAQQGASDKA